jgi:hypothetical protein
MITCVQRGPGRKEHCKEHPLPQQKREREVNERVCVRGSQARARKRDSAVGKGRGGERSYEPRKVGDTGHRAVAQCGANSIFHFGQDRVELQISARARHPLLVQHLRERKGLGCEYMRHPNSATLPPSRSSTLSLPPSPCPLIPFPSLFNPHISPPLPPLPHLPPLPSHSHAWRRKRDGRRRAGPDSTATLAPVYTPPLVY